MTGLWIAYAALAVLNLLSIWIWRPFFKAYAGETGKRLATHEDIEQIRSELRLQTEETESIKAQISGELWIKQIHWNQRRPLRPMLDVVNQLTTLATQMRDSRIQEYMQQGLIAVLDVACQKCPRRGPYRVTRLIDRHGAGMSCRALKNLISPTARSTPAIRYMTSPACIFRAGETGALARGLYRIVRIVAAKNTVLPRDHFWKEAAAFDFAL